jgi:sortase A
MEPIHVKKSRLAYQVDRKILHADEEDHFRLDLSAHEKAELPKSKAAKTARQHRQLKSPIKKKHVKRMGSFAVTALLIYLGLFAITNAAAYTKIIVANVMDAYESKQAEIHQQDAATAQQIAELESEILDVEEVVEQNDGVFPLNIMPTTYENRIEIPSLNINAPIVEPALGLESLVSQDRNELEDQIRSSLLQGVVHYPGTADAGEKGNFFLTGHSSNVFWELSPYNTVFALLPKIEVGADIYATYDQTQYHYRVTDKKEVSPKDVSILAQGAEYQATLMTCTPVGTTLKRLVVTAELIKD